MLAATPNTTSWMAMQKLPWRRRATVRTKIRWQAKSSPTCTRIAAWPPLLDAIERAQAIKTLGPIRLFYMKDDAPVEGFRMVEDVVHKIDGAFNEEAMRLKAQI